MSTSDPIPTATTTAELTTDSHGPAPRPQASTSQQPIAAPTPAPAPAARPTIAAHPLVSSLIPLEPEVYASLRVTLHGQMSKQIHFAHSQLLVNKPLVLHAMPAHSTSTPTSTSTSAPTVTPTPTTAALPRLISTCEILKRTFTTRLLELKHASAEIKAQLGVKAWIRGCKGLHQYTLLTTMQDVALIGATAQQNDRQVEQGGGGDDDLVRDWLLGSGKKNSRPKTKQHASPLLLIVLSPYPIDALANDRAFSYQAPEKLPRLKRIKPPIVENPLHQDPPLQTPLAEEVEMQDGEIASDPSTPLLVKDASHVSTKKKVKVRPNRKKKRLLRDAAEALKAAKELRKTLLGKAGKTGQGQMQKQGGEQGKDSGKQGEKDPEQVKKKRTRRSRGKPKRDVAEKADAGAKQ